MSPPAAIAWPDLSTPHLSRSPQAPAAQVKVVASEAPYEPAPAKGDEVLPHATHCFVEHTRGDSMTSLLISDYCLAS